MIKKHFSEREQALLVAHFETNTKLEDTLLELLFYSGIRTAELITIRVQDLDLDNKQLHLYNAAKDSNARSVAVPVRVLERMLKHCKDIPNDNLVFNLYAHIGEMGSRVRYLQRYWQLLRFKLFGQGCHLGLHAFRHTFAARVFKVTSNNIVAAQVSLGHKNISSTIRYMTHETMREINTKLTRYNRNISRKLKGTG